MKTHIYYCCKDFREFIEYLESQNIDACSRILQPSQTENDKSFKFCPFCSTNLKTLGIKFDKEKTYEISWDENLNLGVSWIDNQHKKLLEKVNALIHEENFDEVGESVRFLQNYVKAHFGTEENLMQKHAYPGLNLQRKQHKYFSDRIDHFSEMHTKSGSSRELAAQVAKELWNWFKGHIKKTDREFGEFLKV